uniref:CCHC-type domain-containing protein n=1 Tax=Cajanus cajan TaxID=3821 RepID=A0A151QL96_CAJCA|nr:hypothetical protein KK1_049172 [Cajanus cajan]
MYWWTSFERERRTHHEPYLQYWNELRSAPRRRYIPPYFERELMDKLQRLQQRNLSVEEYRKQIELLMMRASIRDEERTTIARTSSIKCFKCLGMGHIASQCPTKKIMIIRGNEILSEENTSSSSSSSSEEDERLSSSEEAPCEGDLLIAQRLLTNQPKEQDQSQRENLFHSRCKNFKKTCSLIVDSGSCNNFISQRLVDKLKLTTIAHPKSYKLQWLNKDGPIKVKDQVNVPFSIRKYKDEVLCDTIPMDVSNILLVLNLSLYLRGFIFPKEVPSGFPPLREIEHQIDLVPRASLPNRPAYRTNPQETKEIETQVKNLMKRDGFKRA